jgi:hypothetical protein
VDLQCARIDVPLHWDEPTANAIMLNMLDQVYTVSPLSSAPAAAP